MNELERWKSHALRKPLLLRGARQVGKSWLIREFAKSFSTFIEINFEKEQRARLLFEGDLHIPILLERLSLYAGKKIHPGETLLFLDEIQEYPAALTALRYFKEDFPELHVIAAGSLVEFALAQLGVPVGRLQFLHLTPLSFAEYLDAMGRGDLRQAVLTCTVDPILHARLLDDVKQYLWLGGMPAVVQSWIDHRDIQITQQLQDEIIQAYRQDFLKYARRRQVEQVSQVFDAIPLQLGQKFTYSQVNPHLRASVLKRALDLLVMAGIAVPAYHSSGQGIPLGATKNEKRCKVYCFDVGLAQRMLGLDMHAWVTTPLSVVNVGAIAEQFVAQELIAYASPTQRLELFYWHREAAASNAEVDFLIARQAHIVPIEVKSGLRGGLKSMQQFLVSHPRSPYGAKISEHPFAVHGHIRDVPLYGIEAWLHAREA